ncbi:hypothetical protein AB0M43_07350 [Longispora sp. NPDC051575]|uniref:hypothetical protein n=1 Tax=Longispora sp. NPDC051575 TaxID=3154943 RepID=UPI00341CDD74
MPTPEQANCGDCDSEYLDQVVISASDREFDRYREQWRETQDKIRHAQAESTRRAHQGLVRVALRG